MERLKINPKFKALIPPLSGEEYARLRESLITDGCRDAIVTWGGVIIDGHNRYEICSELNIPFSTVEKEFESEAEAEIWMLKNQLGRRNLLDVERGRLALLLKEAIAARAKENCVLGGGDKKSDSAKSGSPTLAKALTPIDTRKEVAKIAEISHGTLSKIERVDNEAPAIVREAMGKSISINRAAQISDALKDVPEEDREAVAAGYMSKKHKDGFDRILYEDRVMRKLHNIYASGILDSGYITEECVDIYIRRSCVTVKSILSAIKDQMEWLEKLRQLFIDRVKLQEEGQKWKT